MEQQNKVLRFLTIALGLATSTAALAQQAQDILYLKNGSVIHGSVTEFVVGGNVKIQTATGDIFVYTIDQVDKMVKDAAQVRYTNNGNNNTQEVEVEKSYRLPRGYRGFIDISGHANSDDCLYGLTTTHGYQINARMFAGIGVGCMAYAEDPDDMWMPIYAAYRFDILDRNVSPFTSTRIGCLKALTFDGGCFYWNVNFGVRMRRANLSLGYELTSDDYGTSSGGVFRFGFDLGKRK